MRGSRGVRASSSKDYQAYGAKGRPTWSFPLWSLVFLCIRAGLLDENRVTFVTSLVPLNIKGESSMFKRARHQFGWLEKRKRKRGPEVWVWRYHADVSGSEGTKPAVVVGDVTRYPTKSEAWKAAEGIRLAVGNPVQPDLVTFGGLINRFLREALPERKGTAGQPQRRQASVESGGTHFVIRIRPCCTHTGLTMKVQQELLRHSDICTTMNIYTHTVSPALREANCKVVRMILPERKTA